LEGIVQLIVYYVVFMIAGDFVDYFIGLGVEWIWPDAKQLSLVVFLALYFASLWVAWVLAVRLSAPKAPAQPAG
jgi:hypothetical protein